MGKRTRKQQVKSDIRNLKKKLKETVKKLRQYKKFDEHSHHYLGSEKSSSSFYQNLDEFSPIARSPAGTLAGKEFVVNEFSPLSSVSLSPRFDLYPKIVEILETNGITDSDKISRIKELFKRDYIMNSNSINNSSDNQVNASNEQVNTSNEQVNTSNNKSSFSNKNNDNKSITGNNASFFGDSSLIYA